MTVEKHVEVEKTVKPVVEKKTRGKKTAEKKMSVKKEIEKDEPEKKVAKTKPVEPKMSITIQFGGQDIIVQDIISQVKKEFKKLNKGVDLKKVDLYVKPEEAAVYYVANGKQSEQYKIVL